MNEQQQQQQNQEIPRSFIHIEFMLPGSVYFNITNENVSPLQLLTIASYLEIKAKDLLSDAERQAKEQAEMNKIIVPKGPMIKQ